MKDEKKAPKLRFKGFTDDWKQRKLGDVAKITMGQSPNSKNYTDNPKDHILVQGNADMKDGQVHPRIWTTEITKIADKGDLILSVRAPVGDIGKTSYDVVIGRGVAAIKGNEFIFQLLKRMKTVGYWTKYSTGSTFESINSLEINNAVINLPKEHEQNEVGKILSYMDHAITLHEEKERQLERLKSALLQKMFADQGGYPPVRFEGFSDEWKIFKLSSLATMHARIGWQNLRTSEFLSHGKYMLITGTDFNNGQIDFSTCHYVEKERYEQDKHIQIKNGSILITKDGTLGKVAYVQGLSKPATLNAGIFNIEIRNENEIDRTYLFQYLKAPYLMNYVQERATGGTIKHLNQSILKSFPVQIPNKIEQNKIGELITKLDHLINLQRKKLNNIAALKNSLLQSMFI